ncbi:MAG: phosphoribosylglycinamide formyltransferase [Nitrospirales bacterium]|nr:phosphoribosylglycinamide formyltransferase [Nitrospirales bacterium]
MPDAPLRLAVLASGRGSNLQAIIDAITEGRLRAVLAVVISNKAEAPALERARTHGAPAVFLDPKATPGRDAYDAVILEHLRKHDVGLVALAGYMKIVSRVLIDAYANRIMNIHPSLLPAFPGLAAQQQALDWGAKMSGCTVHFVEEGVDTGPIIQQAAVPVLEGDTAASLEARILAQEHRIYPEAIQLFAEGCLTIEGRRVHIR